MEILVDNARSAQSVIQDYNFPDAESVWATDSPKVHAGINKMCDKSEKEV